MGEDANTTRLRRIEVQGRDGRALNFLVPLPRDALTSRFESLPLRLSLRPPPEESTTPASFSRQHGDVLGLVLTWLNPDAWLQLEVTCGAVRSAVLTSQCWRSPLLGGHSLRFKPGARKAAYVRHLRAVFRVARAFEVCTPRCAAPAVGNLVTFAPPQTGRDAKRAVPYETPPPKSIASGL